MDMDGGHEESPTVSNMVSHTRHPAHNYAKPSEKGQRRWVCTICDEECSGTVTRVASHIMGKSADGSASGIKACTGGPTVDSKKRLLEARKNVGDYLAEQMLAAEKKKNTKRLQEQVAEGSAAKKTFTSSQIPFQSTPAATVAEADAAVAKFAYACGVPFNAIDSPEFKAMTKTLVSMGGPKNSDYEPPSRYRLSNKVLDDEVAKIQAELAEWQGAIAKFGCTLTSDGWSDPTRRPISILCSCATRDRVS